MPMTGFSDHSPVKQWAALAALISGLLTVIGSVALWAADQHIDDKYATDADLAQVQRFVEEQVVDIARKLEANTAAVRMSAAAIDSLTLSVLDLEIDRRAALLLNLELERGATQSASASSNLREQQRALDDLREQRAALFERLFTR